MQNTSQTRDSALRYGSITRTLHWLMAVVLAWQFTSAGVHLLAEDSALDEFMWSTHKTSGFLLMVLILIRVLWALANTGRRPPPVSAPARLGHTCLYLLMVAVPLIALIRQYGSGRAFSPFGIPLMPGFEGDKIEWMTELGSNFHGLLGWLLLALTVGHVIAALWHHLAGDKNVMYRIIGTPQR